MHRINLIYALALVYCLLSSGYTAIAQDVALCPPVASKKAVKLLESAKSAKKSRKEYQEVKSIVLKAIDEDSLYAEAWLFLGDISFGKNDSKTMKQAYSKFIELCPDGDADAYFRLGTYLFDTKKYSESVAFLKSFLEFGVDNESKNKKAEVLLFRANLIANPVPYDPVLVSGISTADPEYLAIISPDDEYCFFTRRFDETSRSSLIPRNVEKFMVSKRNAEGQFEKGEAMPLPFNQNANNNEGGATISKDNRLIFFTKNENGNFDLYYSEFIKEKWGPITNLGENVNDSRQWDSQPSFSSDGKTLYFASYRDSVYGTSDLFKTIKTGNSFSKAEPLPFNTNGNEKSPFIHPDNNTFYFSSDSLPGMGGFDIFMCKKESDNKWGKPVNLGYPINTEADEVGFFVSTNGKKGYFASNQLSGAGGYDIYSFDMPVDKRPEKVLFVKGRVNNENDQIPLAAKIELRNLATSETYDVDYDSITGNYASVVLFDADYILTVKKEGYAYNSQYFSKEDTTLDAVVTTDMDFREMKVGEAYKLNNILFSTNSSELNASSQNIITGFANFLNENPNLRVAIHGHTDSEGDALANMKLSHNRAKSVYEFLIHSGISSSRLSFKGFGQTMPLVTNANEEGRAQNRRTEFVIINK